ncbi:MAG: hypothetical protein IPK75_04610 [Acidobacteria bacterium]|jgi:predicted MFS family arabinose efflux permease|nr:hypothetical protein [Acidobacteriota bacterium]
MMSIGGMTVDSLALAALGGFGALVLVVLAITVWFVRQAAKKPGEK